MERSADQFLADEADRQVLADDRKIEAYGEIHVAPSGVLLTCKADRIDLTETGAALI